MKNNFYVFYFSSVHISRKNWHTLLNICFHIAMTTAIYAGGISLNSYPVVCQAVSGKITHFLIFKWCVKLGVSDDCHATGGNYSALLLAVNPAVVWNQCQGNLQRSCVAIATTVGRRVSNSSSTAAYAQVSEYSSLRPTLHTRTLWFTVNKDLDTFWCLATQTGAWNLFFVRSNQITFIFKDFME